MNLSVLQNASKADVRLEPFPHLVIHNALPPDLCDTLIRDYPALDTIGMDPNRNNVRWSYPASRVADNPDISPEWRNVIGYHVSRAFYDEVVDLFSDAIIKLYPQLFPDQEKLRSLHVGVREAEDFTHNDILIDAQISGNTPVQEARSVKLNHVDSQRKLYAGLLYLRQDDDDSVGGDLEIRRFRPDYNQRLKRRSYDGVYVSNRDTELVDTVRYGKNTLVMFINSLESFHGVTVRQPTPYNRLFMNLLGEVNTPLFHVPRTLRSRIKKIQRVVRKRGMKLIGREYTKAYHDGY
jgi:hypothetical protein